MASNPLNDTLNWIKVTGTYTAKGGEKYLTIGCFSAALGLDTLRISTCTFCDEAYYFIDDVSVTLIDSANGIGELEAASKIKVWPNPAKEQFIISNELPSTTAAVVELYSIIGTLGIMDKINGQNL